MQFNINVHYGESSRWKTEFCFVQYLLWISYYEEHLDYDDTMQKYIILF